MFSLSRLVNPQSPRFGFATLSAVFVTGLAIGVLFAFHLEGVFAIGLVVLAVLSVVLPLLARMEENTRTRVTADEVSYRAFFDHAVDGIFRTTPGGHYLAVNQALADIYGYSTPQALIAGLTDIGAQLYVENGRRDQAAARVRDLIPVVGAALVQTRGPGCLLLLLVWPTRYVPLTDQFQSNIP